MTEEYWTLQRKSSRSLRSYSRRSADLGTDKGTAGGGTFTDTVGEEGGTAEDHGAAHAKALGHPKGTCVRAKGRELIGVPAAHCLKGGSEDRRVRTELCRTPEAAEEFLDLG